MTASASVSTPALDLRRQHGRAVNAVAAFLRDRLHLPNVYIEPRLHSSIRPDVLAVDRAGSGDIHLAEIKLSLGLHDNRAGGIQMSGIRQLGEMPAHFRYLVLPDTLKARTLSEKNILFAPDGIGRIGVLLLSQEGNAFPRVELLVEPERFRLDIASAEKVERYLSRAKPDMFVRI